MLNSYLRTLTRAGSLGKLKNLFGGRLMIPRLSLTLATRFGHPETTHFTMLTVTPPPPKPNQPGLTAHPSPAYNRLGSETTATTQRSGLFTSCFRTRFSDRKRCVFDPETQQCRETWQSPRWRQFCALKRPYHLLRICCLVFIVKHIFRLHQDSDCYI